MSDDYSYSTSVPEGGAETGLRSERAWRPIETAPIEQYVLIWDGKLIEIAFRGKHDGWEYPLRPTHWMPLPEPPR